MTDDSNTPHTPENPNITAEEPLTALQKLMIEHGRRPAPEDVPPPVPALTKGVDDPNVMALPNNLTAASIAKMTESLDPAHPAAQLGAVNAEFLSLMVAEDDQTCLLRRQAQTLDTLFHTMLGFGFTPKSSRQKKTKLDKDNIAIALQSQRQCFDVVKNLNATEYTNALAQLVLSRIATPLPLIPNEQKEDGA